ncbi:MAG: hypothetical protein IPQ06_00175 [Chitinophagaceae bacterium]|nr:hypothetical protein [Chitinophagaceae bacterium]MBL0271505.1 hypothetical protein [Chitinophagaceae bacterium]
MKKLFNILLASFVTILTISCKKDATDIPIGTIKVKIDGTDFTFNVQAKATTLAVAGGFGIQIQGNYKTTSTTNLSFTIVRPSPITTGSYTENTGGNPLVTMIHCTEVLIPCFFQATTYGSSSNPVSITITEITGSSVKGTFRGELKFSSGGPELLTNGAFYVRF